MLDIAKKVELILKNELTKINIEQDFAEARVYDVKTVGVQGDEKTYAYVAEITLYSKDKFIWQTGFLAGLSNRITNNIKEVNRVVYVVAKK